MTATVHSRRQASGDSFNTEPENDTIQVQMQPSHGRLHTGTSVVTTASHIINKNTTNKKEPKGGKFPLPPRIITPNNSNNLQKAEQRQPSTTTSSRSYMQDMLVKHRTRRMSGLLGNTAISQSLKEIEKGNAVHEMRLNMREEL